RGLAIWQGGAGGDGLRFAVCICAGGIVGRGRREAASAELGGSGRKFDGHGRISLDGGEFPEIWGGGGELREQERRGFAGGRARIDRVVRASADVHQLWGAGKGRREVAGSAGQLHGGG